MKRFQKFVLLLFSLCLFINVTIAKTLGPSIRSHSSIKLSSLKITDVLKTSILSDFDIETDAEEMLEEESDNENVEFNFIQYQFVKFSLNYNINSLNIQYLDDRLFSSQQLPLLIQFRNIRL